MKIFSKLRHAIRDYEWGMRLRTVWLPMLFAICLGVAWIIWIKTECSDWGNYRNAAISSFFFAACFFFTTMVQFSRFNKNISCIVNAVGILAIAADCYWWILPDTMGIEAGYGHVAVYTAVVISVFIIPTIRQKGDTSFVRFLGDTLVTATLLCLATLLATGAIALLVMLFSELFNVEIRNLYGYIWTFSFTAIFGSMLVLAMPMVGERGMATDFARKIALKLGKFIFLPLLFLYLLVLYVYIAKIVVTWQLPDGMVSYLTAGVMAELLAVEFLLHSEISGDKSSRFWRIMCHLLPVIVLPAVILMTIGIIRRVSDYGWTIDRFYVLGINIWFYIVSILLIVSSVRRFKVLTVIISSFCLLFMLVSVIPGANFASITKRILMNETEQLVAEATPAFPNHVLTADELEDWYGSLPGETANAIASKMGYIADTYGKESVSQWVKYGEDDFIIREYTCSDGGTGKLHEFDIVDHKDLDMVDIPEGCTRVRQDIFDCSIEERRENDIFVLTFSVPVDDNDTIRFRTTLDAHKDYGDKITIRSCRGYTIVIYYLVIRFFEDDEKHCYCKGYLFE